MTMIQAALGLISIPVMVLNFGGGIVGGIWLAILGKWGLIGLGIASMLISSSALSLALTPSFFFMAPASLALDRQRYVTGVLCLALGNLWTYIVMTVWSVGCFKVVFGYYDSGSIWPYLLLSYGMATSPWTYLATRAGPDGWSSHIGAFGACVGAIAVMGVFLFSDSATLIDSVVAFCLPMLVVFIFQTVMSLLVIKEQRLRIS
jgi:hypothetical protein